jgi:hypothetical protein
VRIFKTRGFARFAKAERIGDDVLANAIRQAEEGLVDANLGGGLIKLRVARPGQGKRGGFRTLAAYRKGTRAVFLFGFAKSERENVTTHQLEDLKAVAADILRRSDDGLREDVAAGRLQEVNYEDED